MIWYILAFAMIAPGCLKLFAASRLFHHRNERAGLMTFAVHLLHGTLWVTLGTVTLLGVVYGNIQADLPLPLSIFVCVIFFTDRMLAAVESLWIAGILPANTLRKIPHEAKKES